MRKEWYLDDDATVRVINEKAIPLFKFRDICSLFNYDEALVRHHMKHAIDTKEGGLNKTFVEDEDDGLYCSVYLPLVLSKVAIMDGVLDEDVSMYRIGWIGRIVEETMDDDKGEMYMEAMTKAAIKLLDRTFGG